MQIEEQDMSDMKTPGLEPSFHGQLGIEPSESVISNFMIQDGLNSMRTKQNISKENKYITECEKLDSTDLRPSKMKQF
jgi:hypothetical protein